MAGPRVRGPLLLRRLLLGCLLLLLLVLRGGVLRCVLCLVLVLLLVLGRDGGGHASRISLSPNVLGVRQFVVFFPLHPPVLEPDFDLSLGETERVGDFYPSSPRQVTVEVELLLQLQYLVSGVGRPLPLGLAPRLELTIRWKE